MFMEIVTLLVRVSGFGLRVHVVMVVALQYDPKPCYTLSGLLSPIFNACPTVCSRVPECRACATAAA